jgi:hypothetical protein
MDTEEGVVPIGLLVLTVVVSLLGVRTDNSSMVSQSDQNLVSINLLKAVDDEKPVGQDLCQSCQVNLAVIGHLVSYIISGIAIDKGVLISLEEPPQISDQKFGLFLKLLIVLLKFLF